jgi:hypothetical protein
VSSRARVFGLVALAALLASAVVVAGVLATRNDVPAAAKPRPGHPRGLALYFGVRTDAEARDLERAARLYAEKRYAVAAKIFARYRSPEAQIGAAFAAWPDDGLSTLQALADEHPRSSLVALHLGLALYWARRDAEATAAWHAAAEHQPDTPYAVRAGDFLHPQFAPGLPRFLPSFEEPLRIRVLPPAQELAALRRAAGRDDVRAKLLYGAALQDLGRPRSAERQFAAAARLAPRNVEARAAAAVGLYDKGDPARAFGRLGPLTREFPRAQTVRFHLGVLLLWSAELEAARKQLRIAEDQGAETVVGREARKYLAAIRGLGTR